MSLAAAYYDTTITIPGPATVACRAWRSEKVGGGGFYYVDWIVWLDSRLSRGDSATVAGDVARTVQDVTEVRGPDGTVDHYEVILGHT